VKQGAVEFVAAQVGRSAVDLGLYDWDGSAGEFVI
jgi:hypothetical protein